MQLIPHDGGARVLLEASLPFHAVGLAWLGQAGFAVRHAGHRLLIDPYLSDHLARKYAGTEFPHERMMPPPIGAADPRDLDLVLCTHRHSDHMDPGSLPVLAQNNPRCRFVVPRAERDVALHIGLSESRLLLVNDGDMFRLNDSIEFRVLAAAHEAHKLNDRGEHHFLGFILRLGGVTIYHSGDTLVYDGLANRLREQRIDLALLPVNGRSERLSSRGIAGNMTIEEATELCLSARIPALMPHHWGMFAFNTADPGELRRQIARVDPASLQCTLPEAHRYCTLV